MLPNGGRLIFRNFTRIRQFCTVDGSDGEFAKRKHKNKKKDPLIIGKSGPILTDDGKTAGQQFSTPFAAATASTCSISPEPPTSAQDSPPPSSGHSRNSRLESAAEAAKRVRRVRLVDALERKDDVLEANFHLSKAVVMLDDEPLVRPIHSTTTSAPSPVTDASLVVMGCDELRKTLNLYGLEIGVLNSALLGVVDGEPDDNRPDVPLFGCALRAHEPPKDSGISLRSLKAELARSLGGHFVSQRQAFFALRDNAERERLAKLQGLTHWYQTYRVCPTCANILQMRASKAYAECWTCDRNYFPTITPVVNCLVRDASDRHCILLRGTGQLPTVFTTVTGCCEAGESLESAVRREVAKEVGVDCFDVRAVNLSQAWPPMPEISLTSAFVATADMTDELSFLLDEIEYAQWYSREEVSEALKNTQAHPEYLENLQAEVDRTTILATEEEGNDSPSEKEWEHLVENVPLAVLAARVPRYGDPLAHQHLKFLPPEGSVANILIQAWLKRAI